MAEDVITINVVEKVDNISIYILPVAESVSIAIREGGFGKVDSVNGRWGAVTLTKDDVGLSNADNTSDLDKPISTATQTALDGKIDKANPLPLDAILMNPLLPNPVWQEGLVFYDQKEKTLAYYNDSTETTVNIGQEEIIRVVNWTGTPIVSGQLVYISGSQGQRPSVSLAMANSELTSSETIGMATTSIPDHGFGYIATFGLVHGLDTFGLTVGSLVYLSPTIPGGFTTTKPTAPDHIVTVGYVNKAHVSDGEILVSIKNGYELGELHDVLITAPVNGQTIQYDSALGLWKNVSIPTVLTGTGSPPSASGLVDGTQFLKYTP